MTIEEKRNAIHNHCSNSSCSVCKLREIENCFNKQADIEKNYALLFGEETTEETAAQRPTHWEDEIYQWGKGDDAVGDEVLCALNNIIRGLYTIEGIDGDLIGLCDRLNVSTDYYGQVKKIDDEIDLADLAFRFEVVRTMLFGSKINYDFLGDHLHKVAQERYKASEAYHFEAEYKNRRNGQ